MRILIVRITDRISGAETYNSYLLRELKKNKNLDITFSSNNINLNKKINKLGINSKYINPTVGEIGTKKQFLKALILFPIFIYQYLMFFSKIEKQDLVIFESLTEKIFLTPLLYLLKNKIVWIEHGPFFKSENALILKKLYIFSSFFVKKIIAVSSNTRSDLIKGGIFSNKIETIYIGLNLNQIKPLENKQKIYAKNKLKISDKDFVIGFLGNVDFVKGIDTFINTAICTLSKLEKTYFVVIGEGKDLNWAKKQVKNAGFENKFYFSGFKENIKDILVAVDLLLFPSRHNEGLSIALLEAQAMGIPAVVTDIGGNNEIIRDNFNGIIYRNLPAEDIAKKINIIMEDKNRFSRNSRENALLKFNIEKNSKQFVDLFLKYEK